ncbi:MAG: DUF58 domain-containing protein [Myxococcales bacterium]|nr:DUF58 domain-containing protein [Myxococcales bacterium]
MREVDQAAVERACAGVALALPNSPHRGRVGEVRAASVGSSMEIHDFRSYQPGDDVRQMDWNAVARTGELVLRVRQDEVSPRVEVVLDGSKSMAVSEEKAARAKEVALLLCRLAARQGLDPTLLITAQAPVRAIGASCQAAILRAELDARDSLGDSLRRAPPLRPCGLRLVVSDFLFESPLEALADRLSRDASALGLVQLLDAEDLDPSGGVGARLLDAESGEALERVLTAVVLESYRQRFSEHQRLLCGAAFRVRAALVVASAEEGIERLSRTALAPLFEGQAKEARAR